MQVHVEQERNRQQVMLDIEAELRYWGVYYETAPFYRFNREFREFIPTLKFGYDRYLLEHHQGFQEALMRIRARYDLLPERDRLEWPLACIAITATWQRMSPAGRALAYHDRLADMPPAPPVRIPRLMTAR